jgi:hypothetical protein
VHLIGQPKGKSARQGSPQTSPANGPMPNDQNAKTKQPAPPKTNS